MIGRGATSFIVLIVVKIVTNAKKSTINWCIEKASKKSLVYQDVSVSIKTRVQYATAAIMLG